jgi:hypothetical protein
VPESHHPLQVLTINCSYKFETYLKRRSETIPLNFSNRERRHSPSNHDPSFEMSASQTLPFKLFSARLSPCACCYLGYLEKSRLLTSRVATPTHIPKLSMVTSPSSPPIIHTHLIQHSYLRVVVVNYIVLNSFLRYSSPKQANKIFQCIFLLAYVKWSSNFFLIEGSSD